MKKHLLTLLLCIPLLSIAQSNYKKGYVVNLKGDTLQGYIDYKEWEHNPKNINFKPALTDKPQQLGIYDISYFEISGYEYYERFILKISLDATDLANIHMGIDTSFKTDIIFLKILSKGKNATLYAYNDVIKKRFFVKDIDMVTPQELIYRVYLDTNNGNNIITKNIYYGQLIALGIKKKSATEGLAKYEDLTRQIQYLHYNDPELIKIITMINRGDEASHVKNLRQTDRTRLFFGIGLNKSTLTYVGDGTFPNGSNSSSSSPVYTVGFDSFLNPKVGRLLFRVEIAFTMNNFRFTNITNPVFNSSKDTSVQITKQLAAAFTPQLIYNFYNTNNLKVFLGIGLSLNIASYPTNTFTETYLGTTKPINNHLETQRLWYAAPVKAGIVIKKHFQLYTTYIKPFGLIMNDFITYYVDQTTCQIGINYLFGKTNKFKL